MIKSFIRIWAIFNPRDHIYLFLLLILMAGGALLEVCGVGLLVPILAMVQDPDPLLKNHVIHKLYLLSGSGSPDQFVILACTLLLALFFIKNLYLVSLTWLQTRFLYSRYRRKACQMMQYYLERPFPFHSLHNSAQLHRNLQIVQPSLTNVVMPYLQLVTEALVIAALLALLLWNDPLTSIIAFLSLGGVVGMTYYLIRRRLGEQGKVVARTLQGMIQQIQQALGSMKETRVLCREQYFHKSYTDNLTPYAEATRQNSFIGQIPRFVNETAAVSLVLIMLIVSLKSGTGTETFITLGLFAVAAIRMLPSMTRIGGALASIRFYSANLNEVYDDLMASKDLSGHLRPMNASKHPLKNSLRFDEVSFTYENSKHSAVNGLTLEITSLQSVAFVGSSGAGKTTAIDLLLGLYQPSSGSITIDGQDIHHDLRAWQQNIGYVPQQIYLSDASIRENVAFGIQPEQINHQAVTRSLDMAQLSSFIQTLPEGGETLVGEHGVRLSGGQRQRIGIARALYHDPEVLVLDEATAALDNETERAFMDALKNLSGKKTLILIAHRLSTVEHCDTIFLLKDGSLSAQGTYVELLERSEDFQRLAALNPES